MAKPVAFRNLVNSECSPSTLEAERRASELRENDLALWWIRGYFDGDAISLQALYRWDNVSIRGDDNTKCRIGFTRHSSCQRVRQLPGSQGCCPLLYTAILHPNVRCEISTSTAEHLVFQS